MLAGGGQRLRVPVVVPEEQVVQQELGGLYKEGLEVGGAVGDGGTVGGAVEVTVTVGGPYGEAEKMSITREGEPSQKISGDKEQEQCDEDQFGWDMVVLGEAASKAELEEQSMAVLGYAAFHGVATSDVGFGAVRASPAGVRGWARFEKWRTERKGLECGGSIPGAVAVVQGQLQAAAQQKASAGAVGGAGGESEFARPGSELVTSVEEQLQPCGEGGWQTEKMAERQEVLLQLGREEQEDLMQQQGAVVEVRGDIGQQQGAVDEGHGSYGQHVMNQREVEAVRGFERFHGLQPGESSLRSVMASPAGVWGWSRYEQWLGVGPGEFKGEARLGAAWRQAVVRGAIETEGPLVWLGVCVWCSEDEGMEGWCASKSWLLWAGFGVQELGSVVGLEVQDGGTVLCVEAVVVEQHGTMGEGKLWGPREALVGWQSGGAWRQPNLVGVQGLDWGAGEVEPLDVGDQEQWDGWWLDKGEEAVRACLDPDSENVGGLVEPSECEPDVGVLGSWCYLRMAESLEGLEAPQVREQTEEANPPWAKEKAASQVFRVGSLMEHPEVMEAFGADAEVMSWMHQGGYEVKLSEQLLAELAAEGKQAVGIEKPNGKRAQENAEDLRTVVMEVLMKGAYEVVEREGVDNVLPMNLAPKPGKEPPWRLISNAMSVNEFIRLWSVRYETLKTVPLVVRQGDWLFSVDLTDAYHQWLLLERSRRLFGHSLELTQAQLRKLHVAGRLPEGFAWDEAAERVRVYLRPVGLPMGFINACAIFTKVSRVYVAKWRREGKRCVHLLDDLMFAVSGTFEQACQVRDEVLRDLEAVGALVNWRKSVLTPGKCLCFLGMLVDSESYRFFVPEKKVEKLKALVAELLARDKAGEYPEATFRELASMVGKVMSMQVAVPAVRMLTHEVYRLIRPEGEWDNSVVLTRKVVDELLMVVQWIGRFNKMGNPIRRFKGMTELVVTVDAGTGLGWRLEGRQRSEELTEEARAVAREWADAAEGDLWQCWKELLAVERCLQEEKEKLQGVFVLVRVDARTSLAYINKGKGSSEFLSQVMRRIFELCLQWSVSLVAEHIAGERMIATSVDSMSRVSEFALAPKRFRELNQAVGFGCAGGCRGYTLDLFAVKKSAKCQRFCSRGAVDGAVGDARTFRLLETENVWACPPLGMLPEAVMMLVEAGVQATVVVPVWPNQPWFGLLRAHAVGSRALVWHEDKPVMVDLADRRHVHPHAVDKWDFVAFVLGAPMKGCEVPSIWPGRRRAAAKEEAKRVRSDPALWRRQKRTRRSAVDKLPREVLPRTFRRARVLSVCHGIGVASLCFQRMQTPVDVTAVELDAECRAVTKWHFPQEDQGCTDVRDLEQRPLEWFQSFDLMVGGFPCKDVSSANKSGAGLEGSKSNLFFVIKELVHRVRSGGGHFLLECTDFVGKHTEDFKSVGQLLGAWPVVLYAPDVSAGYKRRAYWASFPIGIMEPKEVHPTNIMEKGRKAVWSKLSTVMASGARSWNSAKAAVDRDGVLGPLLTVEMERQMGLDDGFTALQGLQEEVRHRMVGNAFQANVMEHILRSWVNHVVLTRGFDSTLGFPGEGPSKYASLWGDSGAFSARGIRKTGAAKQHEAIQQHARRESTAGCFNNLWGTPGSRQRVGARQEVPASTRTLMQQAARRSPAAQPKRRVAAWRDLLPPGGGLVGKRISGLHVVDKVGGAAAWGSTKRTLLKGKRTAGEELKVPEGQGYERFVAALRKDLVLSARSDGTWKSYKGWVECFRAWLLRYECQLEPAAQWWPQWMEVLMDSVAILGLCYAMGTLDVYTAAVSAFMQDGGMQSPYESREFKMIMEGQRRSKGLGKRKKPPVEPWHVAKILASVVCPTALTRQQWVQAKVILMMGWQLFNRPEDFTELQICDFVLTERHLEVTIRYAKNDPRGLTRSPKLSREGGRGCVVGMWEQYVAAENLTVLPQCTKVKGVPTRCEVCGPAFPAIWKHGGQQRHAVSPAMVTIRVKALFMGLAETGVISVDEAKMFSGKSMRCGGVSAAAAEAVRDGVLQGHGGWLQRSL